MQQGSRRRSDGVAIVLLSLLRKEKTENCLRSLYAHTRRPFEVVVVSQESDRATVAWAAALTRTHENLRFLFNKKNVGPAVGRNQAVRSVKTEHVVFLDNDARVTKKWLEPLLETMEKDKRTGAVGALIVDDRGRVQYCGRYMEARRNAVGTRFLGVRCDRFLKEDSSEARRKGMVPWYPTTCLLVRRDLLELVSGFDERFLIAEEDKDICLAIRKAGRRIRCNPASRVVHDRAENRGAYSRIRRDPAALMKDVRHFEEKWGIRSIHEFSRGYLRGMGVSERRIDEHARLPFSFKVIDG
jgi:GT2 family glycosyltransferase